MYLPRLPREITFPGVDNGSYTHYAVTYPILSYLPLPISSESEAGESSDDELPAINLTPAGTQENKDRSPGKLQLAHSGTRKRIAACSIPMMSLIRQPKRSRTAAEIFASPSTSVTHVQPVSPSKYFGAQPREVLPISQNQSPRTLSVAKLQPSHQMSSLGSGSKEPTCGKGKIHDSRSYSSDCIT